MTGSKRGVLDKLSGDFKLIAGGVMLLWLVGLLDWIFLDLSAWGLLPRSFQGLAGVGLAPLIHTGPTHLIANTVPLCILGAGLLVHGRGTFFWVNCFGFLLCGLLTWLFARGGTLHVGASGLAFSYFGALLALGLFERSLKAISLSLIAFFLYSGTLWGLLPGRRASVSWEMHLFGFCSGIIAAWARPASLRGQLERAAGTAEQRRSLRGGGLLLLMMSLLSLNFTACGAQAEGGSPPRSDAPAPSLEALLNQAARRQAEEAQVSISWLIAQPVAPSESWQETPDPEVAAQVERVLLRAPEAIRSPIAASLTLHELSPEALPIDRDALSEGAPAPLRDPLLAAERFFLLSYRGDPLPAAAQVRWLCEVAATLSAGERAVSAQLGLQTLFNSVEVQALCGAGWTSWIYPSGERLEGEALRLITRGAAAYGLPDLELGPFGGEETQEQVARFRHAVEALMSASPSALSPGGTLADFRLAPCERPRHHYESRCLRLVATPAASQ